MIPLPSGQPGRAELVISARGVLRVLLMIVACLALAGVASQVVRYRLGDQGAELTLVKAFDLDREDNFPSWYASVSLCFSGLLFGLIAAWARRTRQPWSWHWAGLSAVFVVLSMDELLELHERLIDPFRDAMHLEHHGLFYFSWVVPVIPCLIIGGLASARFLRALPARTRWAMLAAAGLYIVGAVGFEMLGGLYVVRFGMNDLGYALLAAMEETLEKLGVAVLIYGLLDYMALQRISVHLSSEPPARRTGRDRRPAAVRVGRS